MLIKYYHTSSWDKTTPVCNQQGRSQEFLSGIQNSPCSFSPRLKHKTKAVSTACPLPENFLIGFLKTSQVTVGGLDPIVPKASYAPDDEWYNFRKEPPCLKVIDACRLKVTFEYKYECHCTMACTLNTPVNIIQTSFLCVCIHFWWVTH